jgi:hypothetical protein
MLFEEISNIYAITECPHWHLAIQVIELLLQNRSVSYIPIPTGVGETFTKQVYDRALAPPVVLS